MKRWLAFGLVSAWIAGLAGCADKVAAGPAVTVEVWDAAAGCFARCKATAPLDPQIAKDSSACPEDDARDTCEFRQGQDRIRVTADYAGIDFETCSSADLPEFRQVVDEQAETTLSAPARGCLETTHLFARKEVTAPTGASSVRFRLSDPEASSEAGTGYFKETPRFDLVAPSLALTVEKYDAEQGCFARCAGTAKLDPKIATQLNTPACAEPAHPDGIDCSLRQGQDRIRLVADYPDVSVKSCAGVDKPSLTYLLDDQGEVAVTGSTAGCLDGTHVFAHKVLPTAPVANSGGVRFRASMGGAASQQAIYFAESPTFPLVAATGVISVERWNADHGCYVLCDGTGPLDAAVAAQSGQACTDTTAQQCSFQEAQDQIRITVDYSGVDFPICTVDAPTIEAVVDDKGAISGGGTVTVGCIDTSHVYAQKVMPTAPVSQSNTVRFRITPPKPSGSTVNTAFQETVGFELLPVLPKLRVPRCEDANGTPLPSCTLVAGVDKVLAIVTTPFGVSETSATINFAVGGESSASSSPPLSVGSKQKVASTSFDLPPKPDAQVTVSAVVGSYQPPTPITITLVAPDALQMQVAKDSNGLSFPNPPAPPTLTAGDPTPECRLVVVGVYAPDGAANNQVTLQSSQGPIDGIGDKVQKTLVPAMGGNLAFFNLALPASPSSQLVQLAANGGGLLNRTLLLTLDPVWPLQAQVATAKKAITVDKTGSQATSVAGTAIAPLKASFLAGTKLAVVVTATPASPMPPLECGTPSSPSDLACDPTDSTQLPGGCLLAPKNVAVSPSGDFTIPLSSGVCFAGTITVDVYSRTYTSTAEPCLGDRTVSATPLRLTSGLPLTLTYGP